jgi:hypothetical protein
LDQNSPSVPLPGRPGLGDSGAGETIEAAREPATVTVESRDDSDDLRIAFVSATDNTLEFRAGENSPGTAYLDLEDEREARETMVGMLARRARRRSGPRPQPPRLSGRRDPRGDAYLLRLTEFEEEDGELKLRL